MSNIYKLFPECRQTYQNMELKTEQNQRKIKDVQSNEFSDPKQIMTDDEEEEEEKDIVDNSIHPEKSNYPNILLVFFISTTLLIVIFATKTNDTISIDYLKEKYPLQPNETFDHIEIILEDRMKLEPTLPAVFLFLYMNNNNDINHLTHDIAVYAAQKLRIDNKYIELDMNDFRVTSNGYGYLIDKYKPEMIKRAVMVVKELQNIPASVAQAFHTFCDEESPLVRRAVYIFTMRVNAFDAKEEHIAEFYLKRNWNELDNDILMPLIARITATVTKIYS